MSESLLSGQYRRLLKDIKRSIYLVYDFISMFVAFLNDQIMKLRNINIDHENIKYNNIMRFLKCCNLELFIVNL